MKPQFSVRELLIVVLAIGVGIAGLRSGGVLAAIAFGGCALLFFGAIINALVARGRRQAFAIGFLATAIAYAAIVLTASKGEFERGVLPTTKLLAKAHAAIADDVWMDFKTGKVIPDYDGSTSQQAPAAIPTGMSVGGGIVGGVGVGLVSQTPDRAIFMRLGHALIAMLLGYVGAKYAVFVHLSQRTTRE